MGFTVQLGTGNYVTDITDVIPVSSVNITDSQEAGADTFTFQALIENNQYNITVGNEIQVYSSLTTTSQSINNSVESVTVASVNNIYINDILVISDSEHVKVTNIVGYELQIERGVGSTTAVSHSSGATVSMIEFGGHLTAINKTLGASGNVVEYVCEASDYVFMLDRRFVNKVYPSDNASTGIKRTDANKTANDEGLLEQILYDLRLAADNDKGLNAIDTFYDAFYSNISTSNVDLSPTIKQQIFKRVLPSDALTTIAGMSGYTWWLDNSKQIHFTNIADFPARHLPVVDGDFMLDVDSNTTDYFDMDLSTTIDGAGTKAVLADPLVKSAARITETSKDVGSTDGGGMGTAQAANVFKMKLSKRPFSDLDITELKITNTGSPSREVMIVGTKSGTTYGNLLLEDVHRDVTDETSSQVDSISLSTTAYAWLYMGTVTNPNATIRFMPDVLEFNDVINVTYNYMIKNDYFSRDTESIDIFRDLTGGDGVHEFVYQDAREITAEGAQALDDVAGAILFRKAKIFVSGSFSSHTKGWKAGQIFRLRWSSSNIDEIVWVVNVDKSIIDAQGVRNGDTMIEHNVSFANLPRGVRQ